MGYAREEGPQVTSPAARAILDKATGDFSCKDGSGLFFSVSAKNGVK